MIICPICSTENSHLAVACTSCGSYVQQKVDTLDLFSTVWTLVESPKKAFLRIAIASHKNYILLLAGAQGIAMAFSLMWVLKVGDSDVSLAQILAAGFAVGPLLGVINLHILAAIQKLVARLFKLRTAYKNSLAVAAYACVPVVLSVVLVLPIEILTFGKYFYSTNPSPYLLKPASYVTLLILDGLCVFWSVALYVIGIRALYDLRRGKALLVTGLALAIYAAVIASGVVGLIRQQPEDTVEKYLALDG